MLFCFNAVLLKWWGKCQSFNLWNVVFWMISTHVCCIQQHFLCVVKVVNTLQCFVYGWHLVRTSIMSVMVKRDAGCGSVHGSHAAYCKKQGEWEREKRQKEHLTHNIPCSTSVNIKSSNTDLYVLIWGSKAAVLKRQHNQSDFIVQ